MAITPFGRGRDSEASSDPSPSPTSNASGNSSGSAGLTAFIDQGSEFEGKLSFRDTVRIDGRFCGEISSENTLIVGESGEIEANICSRIVAISGTVTGNIVAQEKVVLHKTARVSGNVQSPTLVVEEGAAVNGQITMTAASEAPNAGIHPVSGSVSNDDANPQ